jgi:hypothetical protein
MTVKVVQVEPQTDLRIERGALEEAGLKGPLQIIVGRGEIRILPVETAEALRILDELAGCLGQEPATAYDFQLKIGGLYEAR